MPILATYQLVSRACVGYLLDFYHVCDYLGAAASAIEIGSRSSKSNKGQGARLLRLHLLLQPNLDQRLNRHITGIGRRLDRVEQVLWQAQRDRLRRGFQGRCRRPS